MKFLNILLKESRKEDLKKKYSDKFDEETLDWILNISDLVDFNHKYTDFVLKVTDPEIDASPDWIEEVIGGVKMFDKYQSQLDKKDINQYRSFEELEKALEPFKEREKEKELEKQTDKVFEDDNFLVLVPKTQEASCKYGSGTKWCVTQYDGGHFDRYTRGSQSLFFILRKKGQKTTPHYKVALHIDSNGKETWWDSQDKEMNQSSVLLFTEYFSDLYDELKKYHENVVMKKRDISNLDKIFDDQMFYLEKEFEIVKNPKKILKLELKELTTIPDMPGHAMGILKISVDSELIDAYEVMITYKFKSNTTFSVDVGFAEYEGTNPDFEPKFDLKCYLYDFKQVYVYGNDVKHMRAVFSTTLLWYIYSEIQDNRNFLSYITKSSSVWKPNIDSYGYTFSRKNKGLISKLIKWLDKGNTGTKLDFLIYSKKIKQKNKDGQVKYVNVSNEREIDAKGYFSSFFASARLAGIIEYKKEGRKFIITKGPNFEAFKKGELKAL